MSKTLSQLPVFWQYTQVYHCIVMIHYVCIALDHSLINTKLIYIFQQAERKNKELIHFADDTRVLEEAAKASVEQIHNEIKTLEHRITLLKRETQLPTTQHDIKQQMGDFLQVTFTSSAK